MIQATLWDDAGEIVVNTRRGAAAAIERQRPNMLRQVYHYIRTRGERGATDEEIAAALGMKESTARARRCELRDAGQVKDSGRRRRGCSGRLCVIWIPTNQPLG